MVLVLSNSVTKYTVFPVRRNVYSITIEVGNALFGRFSGAIEPAKTACAVVLRVRRVSVKDLSSAEEKRKVKKKKKAHHKTMKVPFNEIKLPGLEREYGSGKCVSLSSTMRRYLGLY